MKFRVYKHIVIDEQFLGAFSQSMNTAIFIRAYHKEHPDASLYVHTDKHTRHIHPMLPIDEINTQLIEMAVLRT